MSTEAKFVKEITVIDPDTKGEVNLAVYKHQNGGMFAMDASYLDQVADENEEVDCYVIPDPFATIGRPEDLNLVEE
jgi:hypothetical protein